MSPLFLFFELDVIQRLHFSPMPLDTPLMRCFFSLLRFILRYIIRVRHSDMRQALFSLRHGVLIRRINHADAAATLERYILLRAPSFYAIVLFFILSPARCTQRPATDFFHHATNKADLMLDADSSDAAH